MSYENILFKIENGIAMLTLNRPDKLNSFTQAMHLEVRDALDTVAGRQIGARAGADRRRPRLLRRPGPVATARWSRARRASTWANRSRSSTRRWCMTLRSAADAGHLRRQRRGRRRRRQPGAGLRHRAGRQIGQLRRSLLQAGPDPGYRRHLAPAAPDRPRARHGPGHAGREAAAPKRPSSGA